MIATGRYGPQTPQVEALIARAATLTAEEFSRLATAWDAVEVAAWSADWASAWSADWYAAEAAAEDADRLVAWAAARASAWLSVQAAARAAVLDDVRNGGWGAIQDAVLAVAVRDLIDQAHYDALTWPWRSVVGQLHPDDAPPATTRGATS